MVASYVTEAEKTGPILSTQNTAIHILALFLCELCKICNFLGYSAYSYDEIRVNIQASYVCYENSY